MLALYVGAKYKWGRKKFEVVNQVIHVSNIFIMYAVCLMVPVW